MTHPSFVTILVFFSLLFVLWLLVWMVRFAHKLYRMHHRPYETKGSL